MVPSLEKVGSVPGSSSWGVFLSYRREDAAPYARLLKLQLRERLPGAQVFMDLDSIEPGLDFAEVIREAVGSCVVLVALIGRQWSTLTDEDEHRRLDNPDDYVRFEVQAALERGVRIIPVLVDGARPLRKQQLPAELEKLARLNALELSYGRYEYDADQLLTLIQRLLAAASETRNDRARATRLLADAERFAQSIAYGAFKARALAAIATAVAGIDPDRAARLTADAERAAQSITDSYQKGTVPAEIVKALAAIDPDHAERNAQSITNPYPKAEALAAIAAAVAATDPDRAARLTADAEGAARRYPDDYTKIKASVLARVAGAVAATDPDRAARLTADAERIAQSNTDADEKAMALIHVAKAVADRDRPALGAEQVFSCDCHTLLGATASRCLGFSLSKPRRHPSLSESYPSCPGLTVRSVAHQARSDVHYEHLILS